MNDFNIILPIYNQPGYSEYCIRSLYKNTGNFELLVVSSATNQKTKEVLTQLKEEFDFEIYYVKERLSWASAINIGISIKTFCSESKYTILLHNDCFIGKNFLEYLSLLEDLDPQIAGVIPRTTYSREKMLLTESSIVEKFQKLKPGNKETPYTFAQVTDFLKLLYKDFQQYAKPIKKTKQFTYCQCLETYCLIIRTDLLLQLPAFNEKFVTTGWGERLWHQALEDLGYEIWILNEINVHHHGNLTTDSIGFNYQEDFQKDELLYQGIINGSSQNSTDS